METKYNYDFLKSVLEKEYKTRMVYGILGGTRRPSYDTMFKLKKEHDIPFEIWMNIKNHILEEKKAS